MGGLHRQNRDTTPSGLAHTTVAVGQASDKGVTGMRAEERRTMIAPPTLSKRTHYAPGLSRDDPLHYNVEPERVEIEP